MIDDFKITIKTTIEMMLNQERKEYLKEHRETKGNGFYSRSVKTVFGKINNLNMPRTRDGSFKSGIITQKQYDNSLAKLIIELFVEGVSNRRVEGILKKCFNVKLSHASIANIAKAGKDEIRKWTERSLKSHYACVFIDAFYFPLKRNSTKQEAVYVAMSISPEGHREVLGYWIPGGNEGATNWEEILISMQKRGVKKIDFIIADGLTGIQGVISRVYPQAKYQYCVLHAIRSTLNKVRAADQREVGVDLKKIYHANNQDEAKIGLFDFMDKWEKIYPKATIFWKKHFLCLTQFMVLPQEIRKYVYTTNCLESSHKETKRRLKVMEQFQSEQSAEWILYRLYKRQNEKYTAGINHWKGLYAEYLKEQKTD